MRRKAAWQGTYPADGDSAVAEILFGDELIGDLRVTDGEVHIALYPATPNVREFGLDEFLATLAAAQDWLVSGQSGHFAKDP